MQEKYTYMARSEQDPDYTRLSSKQEQMQQIMAAVEHGEKKMSFGLEPVNHHGLNLRA